MLKHQIKGKTKFIGVLLKLSLNKYNYIKLIILINEKLSNGLFHMFESLSLTSYQICFDVL